MLIQKKKWFIAFTFYFIDTTIAMLKMLISLVITAFLIGKGRSQTALQETKELTKNVYSFANIAGPFSLFSMFIVTKTGVIVIEPYNTHHSTLLSSHYFWF